MRPAGPEPAGVASAPVIHDNARRMAALHWLLALLACGCAATAPAPAAVPSPAATTEADSEPPSFPWEEGILPGRSATDAAPLAGCDEMDEALGRLASELLDHPNVESTLRDIDALTFVVRSAGLGYVWPRALRVEAGDPESPSLAPEAAISRWLAALEHRGVLRCGVGRTQTDDRQVLLVVASDVLADLTGAVPVRVRMGQWIELRAELFVHTEHAQWFVVGPDGSPFRIPTSLSGRAVLGRFAAGTAGPWTAQLVADPGGDPRQVLEVSLFCAEAPPTRYVPRPVPGEEQPAPRGDPLESLWRMANRARSLARLPPLQRDAQLDRLAAYQAREMLSSGGTSHWSASGPPSHRLAAAGLYPSAAGENVVHARDSLQAQRRLWASASHRSNLLDPLFVRVGLGLARDPDGSLWICQLFSTLD